MTGGNRMIKRCMGCMEQFDNDVTICPYCGHQNQATNNTGMHIVEGTILNQRYIIGKPLGFGGFGVTYIAWDTVLQCKVAIKEYMPSEFATRALNESTVTVFTGDHLEQFQSGLEKFREEAIHLAQFNSVDGIVHVYDCISENNTAYIIMELLNGETLSSFLEREGKIPAEKAVQMILPVAEALKLVHQEGIIHYDIAPDNLFLTNDGKIKLIDFGASRFATTQHSRSLSVLIKEGYSPEEQYRSQRKQGAYTDIYALGAVLYHMITGEIPPDALKRKNALSNQKKDLLLPIEKFVKDIPENYVMAVYNAMNVQIEDRTQNADQFIYELTTSETVKLRKGHIKGNINLQFPLWAKVTLSICSVLLMTTGVLFLKDNVGFQDALQSNIFVPNGKTRVPSVISMGLDSADEKLKKASLSYHITGKEYSDEIGANLVLTQDINSGSIVEMNSTIELTISGGVEMKTVPDVVGINWETALQKLNELNFSVTIQEEYHNTIAENSVISQSIPAGTDYPVGEKIILFVSMGQSPEENLNFENDMTIVPDFVGKTYDEAIAMAEEYHLTIRAEDKQYSSDFVKDMIMSQKTEAGTEIESGSVVELVVSLGERIVKVPDVQYQTLEEGKRLLEANDLPVQVTYELSDIVQEGFIISQNPVAGTELAPFSPVTIIVSGNMTSMEEEEMENIEEEQPQEEPQQEIVEEPAVESGVPNIIGMNKQQAIDALSAAGY